MVQAAASCVAADASLDPLGRDLRAARCRSRRHSALSRFYPAARRRSVGRGPPGCAFGYFKPLHHSPRSPPSSRARRAPRPRNSADRIPAPALGLSRGDRAAAGARRRAGGRRPPFGECTRQRDGRRRGSLGGLGQPGARPRAQRPARRPQNPPAGLSCTKAAVESLPLAVGAPLEGVPAAVSGIFDHKPTGMGPGALGVISARVRVVAPPGWTNAAS